MPTPEPSRPRDAYVQMDLGFWPTGPQLVDVSEMRKKQERLSASARAENSRRAYLSDFRSFEMWCRTFPQPYCALPATEATICDYISAHSSVHRPSTIQRRLAGIRARHLAAGHSDPVRGSELVRAVMRGLRREDRSASAAKAAISLVDLRLMLRAVHRQRRPFGSRNAAVLLVGFAGGFRRSELAALELSDVRFVPRRGMVITIRRSKADQEGKGADIGIALGSGETCPVGALKEWLRVRGSWAGPLFSRVDFASGAVSRDALSGQAIAAVVKVAASSAGMDPAEYAGHSLRAGLVTAAHAAGVPDSTIMRTTRHKSVEMLSRYIRHSSALVKSPAAGLL